MAAALKWVKKASGSAVSAAAGDYRIHRSGLHLVTAYRMNPFTPLGTYPGAKDAMEACQKHFDQAEKSHDHSSKTRTS